MKELEKIFNEAIKKLYGIKVFFSLRIAKKGEGHYSFVHTMKIAKDLGKKGEDIAKEIMNEIGKNENIKEFLIVNPGFLNFYVSDKFLFENIGKKEFKKNNKTIVVDYGGENIAKYMSVGHLRSNIIGKAIVNIYEKLGWNVKTDNHLGDYGTQFGKLVYAYKKWGDDKLIAHNPIEELNNLYVKFHDEVEKNKSLEDCGRAEFKKLEDGDEENKIIWQKFVDYSLKEFQEMYDILGSKFDTMLGESFFVPMLSQINSELDKIGTVGEGGAKIVEFEDLSPMMYQKGDGTSLYATRDLATVRYRIDEYHPQKIVYLVGNDQSLHFRQFFKAAEMMGWTNDLELFHIRFGLVSLPEGKMSTRKGRVVKMRELIETGIEETRKMIEAKEAFHEFSKEEKEKLIKDIAVGAIKYNDLSQDREGDIVFTWDKALNLEGMSGPYMQYAHARTCGIIRKNLETKTINSDTKINFTEFSHEKERDLVFHLTQYYDVLERAACDYKPHHIARFIFELSQEFNGFYQACQVMNEKNQDLKNMRFYLVKRTQEVLKEGLELLGIVALERM